MSMVAALEQAEAAAPAVQEFCIGTSDPGDEEDCWDVVSLGDAEAYGLERPSAGAGIAAGRAGAAQLGLGADVQDRD